MKRVRWACPNGCPAVLASTRPRRDDVARYCLSCSAKSGRLVLRTAPALDTKREAKAVAAKAKKAARAQRATERETAYHTVHGVDLREELKKLWSLPIARELRTKLHPQHRVTPPKLVVRNRSEKGRYGVAWWHRHEILINRIPGHDAFDVRDTLAHEVAHILTPGARHDVAWKTAFRLLCEQAYGVRPRVENRFTNADTMMRTAAVEKHQQFVETLLAPSNAAYEKAKQEGIDKMLNGLLDADPDMIGKMIDVMAIHESRNHDRG